MTEDELFDLEDELDGFVDGVEPLTGQGSDILDGLKTEGELDDEDESWDAGVSSGAVDSDQQTLEDIFKQFGADGWQNEHEESGVYKVDFAKGEVMSGDGKTSVTEWYRSGADAEQAQKHESMLQGWLSGNGGEQIIMRVEGGIVRVTRMWMEGDGTVNSETIIKELEEDNLAIETRSFSEPDDDDDYDAVGEAPIVKEVSPQPKSIERIFLFERKFVQQIKISEIIPVVTPVAKTAVTYVSIMPKTVVGAEERSAIIKPNIVENRSLVDHFDHDDDGDAQARTYQEMSALPELTREPIITSAPRTNLELFGVAIKEQEVVREVRETIPLVNAQQKSETVLWTNVFTIGEPSAAVATPLIPNFRPEADPPRAEFRGPEILNPSFAEATEDGQVQAVQALKSPQVQRHDEIIENPRLERGNFAEAHNTEDMISDRDTEPNIGGQLEDDDFFVSDERIVVNGVTSDDRHAELLARTSEMVAGVYHDVAQIDSPQPEIGPSDEVVVEKREEASRSQGSEEITEIQPEIATVGTMPTGRQVAPSSTFGRSPEGTTMTEVGGPRTSIQIPEASGASSEPHEAPVVHEQFMKESGLTEATPQIEAPVTITERNTLNGEAVFDQVELVDRFEADVQEELLPIKTAVISTESVSRGTMRETTELKKDVVGFNEPALEVVETNDHSGITISIKTVERLVVEKSEERVVNNQPVLTTQQTVRASTEFISRREAEHSAPVLSTFPQVSRSPIKTIEWATTAPMVSNRAGALDEEDVEPSAISIAQVEYERVFERA